MVSGNNEEIDSLSENSDRFGKGLGVILFDLNYKSKQLTYHAGTPFDSGNPELEIGVSLENGGSTYDVSLILNPLGGKVWEDPPYVTDRNDTTDRSAGIKLTYEGIAGTPHLAVLKIMNHNIDGDKIGDRFSSMQRDGFTYDLSVGYDFMRAKGKLTPFIGITRDDRDGEAQDNNGAYIKFVDFMSLSNGTLMSSISIDYKKNIPKRTLSSTKHVKMSSLEHSQVTAG